MGLELRVDDYLQGDDGQQSPRGHQSLEQLDDMDA